MGRFNRALQKLFSMKGQVPAPQLSSEIQPQINIPLGVEFRYLEGWGLYGIQIQAPAVAAQNAAVRLRNPAKSGVIVVVEKVSVITGVGISDAPLLDYGTTAVDYAVTNQGFRLDARAANRSASTVSSSGTGVAIGNPVDQVSLGASQTQRFIDTDDEEYPLLPGDAIQIRSQVVNQTLNVSIRWRERPIEDSETS